MSVAQRFTRNLLISIPVAALITSAAIAYESGPPPGFTGGFGDPDCTACHFDNAANQPGGSVSLEDPMRTYVPGKRYALTVALSKQDIASGGFQLAIRDGDGNTAGALIASDNNKVVVSKSGIAYLQHSERGVPTTDDMIHWSAEWQAPEDGRDVTINIAANASNDDSSAFGDHIYTSTQTVKSAPAKSTFIPVTNDMLLNPGYDDWLMYSRTYDNHRYSPLQQINRDNVNRLKLVWSHDMHAGTQENIPLVYQGVMYVANPHAIVQAVDASNGQLLWEYKRKLPDDLDQYIRGIGRARTLAIYGSSIYYASPDGYLLAIDASTGKLRWETRAHDYKTSTQHTTGPMIVNGNVLTGRNCGDTRTNCFIAAHDAENGKEIWKFFVTAGEGDPGGDTWADMPTDLRLASPWGLPGGFDEKRNLVFWGTANPSPHTRIKRHDGNPFAVPLTTPAELFSNSTLALNPDTGELVWYYQHLPGDDWDADHTHERILFRSAFDPDPKNVKWINSTIERGEQRDMVVSVAESGGVWVNDRSTGEFLWAMPFPYDTADFLIDDIDARSGAVSISRDKVLTRDGQEQTTCYQNTRSYWPIAYHPDKNALYVPYHDACNTRVGDISTNNGHTRTTHPRAGSDPNAFSGLAKVDMTTGSIQHLHTQRVPGNGAVLLTAGDLLFWGDMSGSFYAIDSEAGEILWDAKVAGIIQTSTITYAVNGTQYVAILTGDGLSGTSGPLRVIGDFETTRGHNAIYVFALENES